MAGEGGEDPDEADEAPGEQLVRAQHAHGRVLHAEHGAGPDVRRGARVAALLLAVLDTDVRGQRGVFRVAAWQGQLFSRLLGHWGFCFGPWILVESVKCLLY